MLPSAYAFGNWADRPRCSHDRNEERPSVHLSPPKKETGRPQKNRWRRKRQKRKLRKNNTSIENLRLRGSELTEQDLRGHEGKTAFLVMEQLGDEGYGSREGTNLNENLITMQTCMSAMTLREEQDEQRSRDTQTSH